MFIIIINHQYMIKFNDQKLKLETKGKFLNRINSDIGRSFLSLFITLFNFEMRSK